MAIMSLQFWRLILEKEGRKVKNYNVDEEKFKGAIKKFWERGISFSCGEQIIDKFSIAEALAEDGRYMAELDTDMRGYVINVNFQDISE